jgi:hypothetical protein
MRHCGAGYGSGTSQTRASTRGRTIKQTCLMAGRLKWSSHRGRSRVTIRLPCCSALSLTRCSLPSRQPECVKAHLSGLRALACGFADDLVLVTRSAADMALLLQVAADLCAWSGMRIKREKSIATGFDFKKGVALPTEAILYVGAPLTGLVADEAFAYLGARASLVGVVRSRRQAASGSVAGQRRRRSPAPCLAAAKEHIFATTRDIIGKVRRHRCLLSQMVPATAWPRSGHL